MKKAADGGMTEVELGQGAEKNGQKENVKSFGTHMVKDHSKANDDLKSVAGKMVDDTLPLINEHLKMAKEMQAAK